MKFRLQQPVDEPLVGVGHVKMPRRFGARVIQQEDGSPDVTLMFEVRGGAPECREVHIAATEDGEEVTVSGIRGISVNDVLERTVKLMLSGPPTLVSGAPTASGFKVSWPMQFESDEEWRDAVREMNAARSRKRSKITDQYLRDVARVYREHAADKSKPTVADTFDLEQRTARLHIQRARKEIDPETDKPFLGPAIKGKAGEQ